MPSPSLFFETMNAFQRTAALRAALELDVFTALAEGHNTAEALAAHCKAAPRGMRILCDTLTVIGFLMKDADSYALTEDSAVYLNRHSPACVASAAEFWGAQMQRDYYDDLAATVRRGGVAHSEKGNTEDEHPVWVKYATGMAPVAALIAPTVARHLGAEKGEPMKVLDIAAGHGMFGIAIAQQNPNAQIVALDWAPVLEVAKGNAAKAGLSDRYQTIAGSAFDADLGKGYDVVLVTNFIHHFDVMACEAFYRRVYQALKPGGCAATLERVPNEDRVSPAGDAMFSLTMLATTPAGDAYTFAEINAMCASAGFASSTMVRLTERPSALVISVK